jgi:hypothetical protein
MLDPWFESNGLVDANQVLAYFAVSKLGEPPVDGITDTNPEGLTAAFGNWGPAVAARLQNGGLTCKVCSFIRIILTIYKRCSNYTAEILLSLITELSCLSVACVRI